jgi:hypothetical protein
MFGNRTATAASILQKTYDESYLTCSTAVYYESQVWTRQSFPPVFPASPQPQETQPLTRNT